MKRLIVSCIIVSLLLSIFPLQVFAKSSNSYPSAKAAWSKKNTEAQVRIPSFFKTHQGVLIQELYQGKLIKSSTALPISTDSFSLTFPLGFEYVDSGKYTVKMAFCSKDATEITKEKCGKALKKKVNYVKP